MSDITPNPPTPEELKRARGLSLAEGILLGGFVGLALDVMDLGHGFLRFQHLIPLGCVLGAIIGLSPARKLMRYVAGGILILVLVVSYTPLAGYLMHGIEQDGTPQKADAVVVLGGGYLSEDTLGSQAQDRLLHGLGLLKAGYADRLVLTRSGGMARTAPEVAQREMQQLGMNYVVDVVGPVRNTHDEALAVAGLVRERGWKRVILVTHPWHMRRAAAVFEKAGVPVICSACAETRYDLVTLDGPGDRLDAFRDWLHEAVGYWVYQEARLDLRSR